MKVLEYYGKYIMNSVPRHSQLKEAPRPTYVEQLEGQIRYCVIKCYKFGKDCKSQDL